MAIPIAFVSYFHVKQEDFEKKLVAPKLYVKVYEKKNQKILSLRNAIYPNYLGHIGKTDMSILKTVYVLCRNSKLVSFHLT